MGDDDSILSRCTGGGCGAKIGPGELSGILKTLPKTFSPNLIVGFDSADDAAVYKLDEQNSIISTVDFFPPMIDDPHKYGRIAAANALSDVYAMGGTPLLALNLVCFPEGMSKNILSEILAGGAEAIAEAGAVVGGGHSIYDREPKYGLAVTGIAKTEKIIRNNTPRLGHSLILTKPLGTGIVMAALRCGESGGEAGEDAVRKAVATMQRLNRYAAEKMSGFDVSACTDVTGFGLLAHLLEVCSAGVSAEIYADDIPVIPRALEYAGEYLVTAAGQRNRNHFAGAGNVGNLPFALQEILFDPQTSGGLLICVDGSRAETLLAEIRRDDPDAGIIGKIVAKRKETIVFTHNERKA